MSRISKLKIETGIQKAASLILKAQSAIALTGAGYSTASGIPDFRSPSSGLWEKFNPMEVASLSAFRFYPEKFFQWFRPLAAVIHHASPNLAHEALAALEKAGHLTGIVTQNIDGLHQKAGSSTVYEVHGTLQKLACTHCHQEQEIGPYAAPYIEHGIIPRCPHCDNILKPTVILFEEQLPLKTWKAAEKAIADCDLMIVAGTSLSVMPVAGLPTRVSGKGAPIIIINKTPTYLDKKAEVVIREDVTHVLPKIAAEVTGG